MTVHYLLAPTEYGGWDWQCLHCQYGRGSNPHYSGASWAAQTHWMICHEGMEGDFAGLGHSKPIGAWETGACYALIAATVGLLYLVAAWRWGLWPW